MASCVILYIEAAVLASYVIISVKGCVFANYAAASGGHTTVSHDAASSVHSNLCFKSNKLNWKISCIENSCFKKKMQSFCFVFFKGDFGSQYKLLKDLSQFSLSLVQMASMRKWNHR